MEEVKLHRMGRFREVCWTRLKITWRAAQPVQYEVERFEPLARGAEAFLRDQVSYFARLGYRVASLDISQAEGFEGRRLTKPNPFRHWPADGYRLLAQFPEGTTDAEGLITL